jgi:hypothetical protein
MRKPSCLISCSQAGKGGTFAGDGKHGSIIPRGKYAHATTREYKAAMQATQNWSSDGFRALANPAHQHATTPEDEVCAIALAIALWFSRRV